MSGLPSPSSSPPKPPCRVFDFIDYQIRTNPHARAVQFHRKPSTSYAELGALAKSIALGLSIDKGSIVPICMDRSVAFVASILAVLRSGAAYVILDPKGPVERNNGIVKECHSTIVIADEVYVPLFDRAAVPGAAASNPPPSEVVSIGSAEFAATDAAYLIYTSGKSMGDSLKDGVNLTLRIYRNPQGCGREPRRRKPWDRKFSSQR